ncbi:hypothetical protein ACHAWF_015535 [Thalassiosira exigua]
MYGPKRNKVSSAPSLTPTESKVPTSTPSQLPSVSTEPSSLPSEKPSASGAPSLQPSDAPTVSAAPSRQPSMTPLVSAAPSSQPSLAPSVSLGPTSQPSGQPSVSGEPSSNPSVASMESKGNSLNPSQTRTQSPNAIHLKTPSGWPSQNPSLTVSSESFPPSIQPSAALSGSGSSFRPSGAQTTEPSTGESDEKPIGFVISDMIADISFSTSSRPSAMPSDSFRELRPTTNPIPKDPSETNVSPPVCPDQQQAPAFLSVLQQMVSDHTIFYSSG